MRGLFDDLFRAFGLLTRLPFPHSQDETGARYARCVWAYPVVGAVIGALAGLTWFAGQFAGLGLSLTAGLVVGLQVLLTGAMHEDGLADFADGLGGGRDPASVLAIMRDSRIGTYGVVALVLAIGLRWTAIASLGVHMALAGLICSALLGRLVMAVLPRFMPYVRDTGLGALVARPPRGALVAAVVIAVIVLTLHMSFVVAVIALGVSVLAAGWVAVLAKLRIGGYTGDVLGAAGLAVETAALLVFAAV